MFNTRLEKMLRVTHPVNRTANMGAQMIRVFMRAVRKISFTMCPHIFNRIHFWRIPWQPKDMKPPRFLHKSPDIFAYMNRATIQDENHMLAQMAQQIPEKGDNVCSVNVMGMESDVQTEPLVVGGYGKTSNDRDFFMTVAVSKNRCATRRGPGFTDIRYKQEPAFIEKSKMRIKLLGFFLSGAMSCTSNMQWLFRSFARRVFPVSDSSIQNRGGAFSILLRAYTVFHNLIESCVRYVLTSIDRWSIPMKLLLATIFSAVDLSGEESKEKVVPIWRGGGFLSGLSSGKSDANVPPSLGMLSILLQRHGKFCPNGAY